MPTKPTDLAELLRRAQDTLPPELTHDEADALQAAVAQQTIDDRFAKPDRGELAACWADRPDGSVIVSGYTAHVITQFGAGNPAGHDVGRARSDVADALVDRGLAVYTGRMARKRDGATGHYIAPTDAGRAALDARHR